MIAFDECSVLHLCKVAPCPAFGLGELKHKNYDKLIALLDRINKLGLQPHRFVPHYLNKNIFNVINDFTAGTHSIMQMVLQKEVSDALKRFWTTLEGWGKIHRSDDPAPVKRVFEANEQQLKKRDNIPEDEDCTIIGGYAMIDSSEKLLVSEDEHFWGYADVIERQWGIQVIAEWAVEKILRNQA